jgi:hypothetical protein
METTTGSLALIELAVELTPVERLPDSIREGFAAVERAQRDGAEPVGGDTGRDRRYELPDSGIVYFTDATRPVGAAGMLMIVAAVIGVAALLAGFALIVDDSRWGLPLFAVGALAIYAAVRSGRADSAETERRRAGIETDGLYLLPDALVIRAPGGCRVFPRRLLVGFRKETSTSKKIDVPYHEELLYRGPDGAVLAFRYESSESAPVREICQRWLSG